MKIIQRSKIVDGISYAHFFQRKGDSTGSGFVLDCDKDGNVLGGREARFQELKNDSSLEYQGIESREWSYREPAIGECVCGEHVYLDGFTNTCGKCDRDYNSAGQELAPRSQWGEETGEYLSDILRIK